ncbi:MarR family winged helix-turn-helix transcriptional regulator [Hoeflea sp. Naph1]|uniref:MarR family winged helix-turn-helix transcriptional regulator n=1 Tax=Hoeflea sp. Naph1 TaxID=3388653 RepID=UPI00398FDE7D
MTDKTAELSRLFFEIRRGSNALAALGDRLHADLKVTSAMRALMEHLSINGEGTVPDVARAKNVTRQHIQQISNALVKLGLLEFVANPRHKRSPFVALTPKGEEVFAEIRTREAAVLSDLAIRLDDLDAGAVADAIARLRAEIASLDPS